MRWCMIYRRAPVLGVGALDHRCAKRGSDPWIVPLRRPPGQPTVSRSCAPSVGRVRSGRLGAPIDNIRRACVKTHSAGRPPPANQTRTAASPGERTVPQTAAEGRFRPIRLGSCSGHPRDAPAGRLYGPAPCDTILLTVETAHAPDARRVGLGFHHNPRVASPRAVTEADP